MTQISRASIAAAALLSLAGAASVKADDVLFSFNFQNLNGRYDAGSQQFSANADSANSQINSVGTVNRNIAGGPPLNSYFDAGFVAGADPSNFQLGMTVSNILGTAATGTGAFSITDADGDVLSGTISGDRTLGLGFFQFGNFVRFFGELSNVVFTPSGGGTTFNGPSGGSFDFTSIPGGPIYSGALVQLFIYTGGGGFTSGSWGYNPTTQTGTPIPVGLNAELVPAPGAAVLLGLGGVMAGRRRRR